MRVRLSPETPEGDKDWKEFLDSVQYIDPETGEPYEPEPRDLPRESGEDY